MIASILVLASLYLLIALGYVIVYRTSRVLNFAHGDIFMISGYLGFAAVSGLALTPLLALPISAITGAIAGALVYFVLMASMAGHSVFAAVLVTIGLGIVIRGFALVGFKGQVIYPGRMLGFEDSSHEFLPGFVLSGIELSIVGSAVFILAGLMLFFRYSKLGIQMRAASRDSRLAAYRGINIHVLFAIAWALSTSIGMYASALYSFHQQVGPNLTEIALRALAVALVGGMDSLKGTIPAAIAVAAIEILVQRYVNAQVSEVIPYVVLVAVLLVRPWGLFGTKEFIDRV